MRLARNGTTYPNTAPKVVDGRGPRAGRALLRRFPLLAGPDSEIHAVGSDAYHEECRKGGSDVC